MNGNNHFIWGGAFLNKNGRCRTKNYMKRNIFKALQLIWSRNLAIKNFIFKNLGQKMYVKF